MKLNSVIEAGKFNLFEKVLSAIDGSDMIFYITILIALVSGFGLSFLEKKKTGKIIILFVPLLFLLSFWCLFSLSIYTQGDMYKDWEEQYVLPYIEELPIKTYEVQSFIPTTSKWGLDFMYIMENVSESELVTADVVFTDADNKGIQKKLKVITLYDLKEGETPYLETKFLEVDLGNGINSGYINPVVHLPKNFTLNYQ